METDENKKIIVALLGAKTYPPEIGGIETHIYNLSKEFEKFKNVKLLIFTGKGKNNRRYEKYKNIEIYRVPHFHHKYLLKISMVPFILSYLKKNRTRIDIYHTHDVVFGFFLNVLGFRPLVYTAHGCGFLRSDWPFPLKQILKFMEITIFKKSDKLICVDYRTKEVVDKYRNKDTFVIPNGAKPENFENLPRPREYPKDKLIIFSSGRLIPSKGFQDLIDAYLLLDEDIKKKTELFIAGKGPLLDTLKKKASADKRIHILGYVPKIEPYFAYADIFVLPSHYEGFPFTLLEAMAAKTACISTDVGDISVRFKNEADLIIVPPKDVKRLSHSLGEIMKREDLRKKLSKHAFNKIIRDYSWEKITNDVYKVYTLFSRRKQ